MVSKMDDREKFQIAFSMGEYFSRDANSLTPALRSQHSFWRRARRTDSSELLIVNHIVTYENFLNMALPEFQFRFNKKNFITVRSIDDFQIKETLGKGTFGRVVVAQDKGDNTKHYAIKILEKEHIVKLKQISHLHNEIRLLSALDFTFITTLLFAYIDAVYIYMGMPFHKGGDMFHHLRKNARYNEEQTQFYAGQVLLSLEYLHFLGIIYRDLKPENIMFDGNGYIKVIDFGFAKKIDDGRTYTLCGTPDYLAPEVLGSVAYGKSVDWWAFGVLIYEMAAGLPPFYHDNPMIVYEKILNGKYTCPNHFTEDLKDLLSHLLAVDRSKRYGVMKNGVNDIKLDPWFKGLDWESLLKQQIKPICIPEMKHPDDMQNNDNHSVDDCDDFKYFEEFSNLFNSE